MKNRFSKIIIWLGIMAAMTLLMIGVWTVTFGGSQSTESLKWFQLLQTAGTFLLPPIVCAWLWDEQHRPMAWLKMDRGADGTLFAIAIGIMICALPGINLLADLNSKIHLPESLAAIEQYMREMEDAATELTERFLQAENMGVLLINIGLMALLPAIAEELSFRGTLQQIIVGEDEPHNRHMAIWLTAFIFSAIHMQFYGFIPRMLMGAMFGYIFVWSGTLWLPMVMHFTNNALAVLAYHFFDAETQKNYADTLGAGTTWYIGILSLLITALGLLIFYRRTHKR